MKKSELYKILSERIPSSLSEEWDNDGAMIIPHDTCVNRILLSLDATTQAVSKAIDEKFDLIITHHPLIFRPVSSIVNGKYISLIENDIAVFSFHTRFDTVSGGVNDTLASILGLVKIESRSIMRIGELEKEMPTDSFAQFVKAKLNCPCLNYVKRRDTVKKVALVGGDGKGFSTEAENVGADTYITGNMSYNTMIDASEGKLNVIEAGHYNTEFPSMYAMKDILLSVNSEFEIEIFDNNPIVTI